MYGPCVECVASLGSSVAYSRMFGCLRSFSVQGSKSSSCKVSQYAVVLGMYIALEVAFWAYVRLWLCKKLNQFTEPPPHIKSPQDTIDLLVDVLEKVRDYYPLQAFMSKWFRGVDSHDVRRGNVSELLSWCSFSKEYRRLTDAERDAVDEGLSRLEARLGLQFPEGQASHLVPCWMTLEPLNAIHRPLALWYLALWLFQGIGYVFFRALGFRRMRYDRVSYWHRERGSPHDHEATSLPLLFFHGISPGQFAYACVTVPWARHRTTILFETPHIQFTLGCVRPPSRIETLSAIDGVCNRHAITRCMVVGHSFGSIKAGWLASHRPHLVAQLILLDPVSVLLMLPDVCYNFIYRNPSTWFHAALHLAAKEVTIANALQRHFWWYENVLCMEHVRCPVVVTLAENDEVGPAAVVREYLKRMSERGEGPPVDVLWLKGCSHAQCLFDHRVIRRVLMATLDQEQRRVLPRERATRRSSLKALPESQVASTTCD